MENKLQAECFKWLWNTYPKTRRLMYHIPNGGKRTGLEAMKFKAMGVVAGIPDLCLAIPTSNYGALYVEIKFGKGKASPEQENCHTVLQLAGNRIEIVYTLEEFQKVVKSYLADTNFLQ